MNDVNWKQMVSNLKNELSQLAMYVDKTRKGMEDIESTVKLSSERFPQASNDLSTVTGDLEQAANRIMSILEGLMRDQEKVQSLLKVLTEWLQDSAIRNSDEGIGLINVIGSINSRMKDELMEILTNLSFHDLSGQKLKKVMSTLADIEKRLLELALTFGLQVDRNDPQKDMMLKELKDTPSSVTLNQDVVDKILKDLGVR